MLIIIGPKQWKIPTKFQCWFFLKMYRVDFACGKDFFFTFSSHENSLWQRSKSGGIKCSRQKSRIPRWKKDRSPGRQRWWTRCWRHFWRVFDDVIVVVIVTRIILRYPCDRRGRFFFSTLLHFDNFSISTNISKKFTIISLKYFFVLWIFTFIYHFFNAICIILSNRMKILHDCSMSK